MIIRRAHQNDAQGICAIWNEAINTSLATFTTTPKTPNCLNIAHNPYFVAKYGDDIIGFCGYFPFRSGPGYARTMEHCVYITPQAKGTGIATALMKRLESHANVANVRSLIAAISGANDAGIKLHQTIGFTHVGLIPQAGYKWGQWLDLVLMQKITG